MLIFGPSSAREKDYANVEGRYAMDLLPEYCRYQDEGCELFPSCLDCPFPQCVEEIPRGKQRHRKERRNKEIWRLFHIEGKTVKQLAERFRVSRRTVQRALKK